MKNNSIFDIIKERVILTDGAFGTYASAKSDKQIDCFEALNITEPQLVSQIHTDYLEAGAEIIITNSFGANRIKLAKYGLEKDVTRISEAGAKIARDTANEQAIIAGSVGPIGGLMRPYGRLTLNEVREIFREQIQGLIRGGVDYIQFETISSIVEALEGLSVAREESSLPVFCSMTFTPGGTTALGDDIEVAMRRLLDSGADAIGINCTIGPKESYDLIKYRVLAGNLLQDDFIFTVVPNAGYPNIIDGKPVYPASPKYFAEFTKYLVSLGVNVIGGCCGTTPAHIKAMRRVLRNEQPQPKAIKKAEPQIITVTEPGTFKLDNKPIADGFVERLGEEFVVTVEVDPPRGVDYSRVVREVGKLKEAGVAAVNIADNPMARVRMSSISLSYILHQEIGIDTILHLTCRDRNLLGLQSDLIGAASLGVGAILALTGDPSKVGDFPDATSVFDVNSTGLVQMIAKLNEGQDLAGNDLNAPTDLRVGVALNIASSKPEREQDRLKEKLDAGANFAMTQPFYDPEVLIRYINKYGKPDIPLILGVLPLRTYRHALFLHNEVPGISVPERILDEMKAASHRGKPEEISTGVRLAREIIARVKPFADGIYITPPFGRYDIVPHLLEV